MKTQATFKIVIAGGGTGGHLYPGIAIADEFMRQNRKNKILFLNTGNKLEKKILSMEQYPSASIESGKFINQNIFNKIKTVFIILSSVSIAKKELEKFKADAVIGVGGYVGVPVIIAAWLKRIPVFLQEQNSVAGISNKIFSLISKANFVSFENTKLGFENKKVFSGNPIRRKILGERKKDNKNKFTVFITGGSQGARAINNAIIDSFDFIDEIDSFLFIHQTGEPQFEGIEKIYKNKGINSYPAPFFKEIADIYKKSDLIVARAGASTLAEISGAGIPAIFIPYPYATHNHQYYNCIEFEKKGAAIVIEEKNLSGKALGENISNLYKDKKLLTSMAEKMKEQSMPNAANKIYETIKGILEKNHV
ncbi:MAG: undecaprenyldiphospho-muramoylpentapeptide beta-N-acetylglucosaminyltransferase [Desulforegulaceae bacterium]|nr:undecaprenyldiphospho-muramoylpentapeptide beta-N-acetylglucosaminyltransferase [Desulforegulaceae bacterium]